VVIFRYSSRRNAPARLLRVFTSTKAAKRAARIAFAEGLASRPCDALRHGSGHGVSESELAPLRFSRADFARSRGFPDRDHPDD